MTEEIISRQKRIRMRKLRDIGVVTGILLIGLAVVFGTTPIARKSLTVHSGPLPGHPIESALPGTDIDTIDCGKIPGLCEIVSGQNVFYATADARFLIVGRIFDIAARQDVTQPVLLDLAPARMLSGAPRVTSEAQASPAKAKVTWDSLPHENAVVWGKKGARKVAVFSDLNCPHCHRLHAALKTMDVEVHEFFVDFLGSRDKALGVLCADDQISALWTAYARPELLPPPPESCDAERLKSNGRFAAARGVQGTPLLISEDSRQLPGFPGEPALLAWLGESQ